MTDKIFPVTALSLQGPLVRTAPKNGGAVTAPASVQQRWVIIGEQGWLTPGWYWCRCVLLP